MPFRPIEKRHLHGNERINGFRIEFAPEWRYNISMVADARLVQKNLSGWKLHLTP